MLHHQRPEWLRRNSRWQLMRPLQYQTWETFSVNGHADVKIAFTWLREPLLNPLPPGSRVVVLSSASAWPA
jgi:hypothetical protein